MKKYRKNDSKNRKETATAIRTWFLSFFIIMIIFTIVLPKDETGHTSIPVYCSFVAIIVPTVFAVLNLNKKGKSLLSFGKSFVVGFITWFALTGLFVYIDSQSHLSDLTEWYALVGIFFPVIAAVFIVWLKPISLLKRTIDGKIYGLEEHESVDCIIDGLSESLEKEIHIDCTNIIQEEAEPQQGEKQEVQLLAKPLMKLNKDFDPHILVRTDTYTVYYAYGHVQKVLPPLLGSYYENRDIINAATFIVSDGVAYDLTDIQSIRSIKIPNYHIYAPNKVGEELGVTGCLDYVLRMRSGLYWREGNFDLSIACLEKATELMKYSSVGWPPKDFFRIVNELNDLGRFKRAEKWKAWIEHNIPGATSAIAPIAATMESREPLSSQQRKELLEGCKYLDTDLVEVGDSGVCCEVCAKYRNRIYTLTGKDSRFLRFPKDFHKSCGLSVYPYIWGVHEPVFSCSDPVSYSNRPFSDDRTAEEKANREKWLQKMTQQPEVLKTPSLTRIIYYRLKQILPDDSPKSLSGFSRMRKSNSKNYQALVKKAEAAGFVFPQTLDDVAKWPENQ